MTVKEAFVVKSLKLSPFSALSNETAYSRSQRGVILLTLTVVVFIAAVAYADSRVDEISLGYLYVLPVALSGLVNRLRTSFFFVIICVVLHDLYGPAHALPARIFLNLFALLGLSVVALLVNRLGKERQALFEIIRRQRDELAGEIRLAAQVQQRLLPGAPLLLPGIELASGIIYAREMGGDYYDFIELEDGDFGVAVADVSGKGTAAAILMPSIEVALRLDALSNQETAHTFQNLNKVVYDVTEAARFITLFYGKLQVREKRLEYINAGHNPPLLYRTKTQTAEWLEAVGTPLGLFAVANYAAKTTHLEEGDVLVCYTDGLSEAENSRGKQFSKGEIARVTKENSTKSAREIFNCLLECVEEFRGGDKFDDDLTLIVLKISASA